MERGTGEQLLPSKEKEIITQFLPSFIDKCKGVMVILLSLQMSHAKFSRWVGKKDPSISQGGPPAMIWGPSSLSAAPRNRSPLASSSDSSEAVPKQRPRRMRGRKRRKLMDVKAGMCPRVCLSFPAPKCHYCWMTTYHLVCTRLNPGPVLRVSCKARTPLLRWVTSMLTQNLLFLQLPRRAASQPPTPPPQKLSLSWGPGRRGDRRGTYGRSIMLREQNSGWTRGEDPVTVLKTKKHSTDFWVCALSRWSVQGPTELSHVGGRGSGVMLKLPPWALSCKVSGRHRHRVTLLLRRGWQVFPLWDKFLEGERGGYSEEYSAVKTFQNQPRGTSSAHWDAFV